MHSLRITTTIICCMRIIATTGFDLRSKVLCNDRTSFKPTKPSTNQAKHQPSQAPSTSSLLYEVFPRQRQTRPVKAFPPLDTSYQPILQNCLLIVGNTIGAACLALPAVAAPLPFYTLTELFTASFAINLISGVVISEVAINSRKASSFKDLVDEAASDNLGTLAASMSTLINWGVLSFSLSRCITEYTLNTAFFLVAGICALLTLASEEVIMNLMR